MAQYIQRYIRKKRQLSRRLRYLVCKYSTVLGIVEKLWSKTPQRRKVPKRRNMLVVLIMHTLFLYPAPPLLSPYRGSSEDFPSSPVHPHPKRSVRSTCSCVRTCVHSCFVCGVWFRSEDLTDFLPFQRAHVIIPHHWSFFDTLPSLTYPSSLLPTSRSTTILRT